MSSFRQLEYTSAASFRGHERDMSAVGEFLLDATDPSDAVAVAEFHFVEFHVSRLTLLV